MAEEMSIKGVLWLIGFHLICWVVCHLTLTVLLWSFPVSLVAFYAKPRESRQLLQLYVIPFLKKMLDYIHGQIGTSP